MKRALCTWQSMYIFKQGRIGGEVTAHQDATYLFTAPHQTCLGLWLALDDATLDNGCLWARKGSHREPIRSQLVCLALLPLLGRPCLAFAPPLPPSFYSPPHSAGLIILVEFSPLDGNSSSQPFAASRGVAGSRGVGASKPGGGGSLFWQGRLM